MVPNVLNSKLLVRLKLFLSEILELRERYLLLKKLKKLPHQQKLDGIYLNYGSFLFQETDGILHGGKVKINHLKGIFPENQDSFNLIYLVSSACPPLAEVWVRWAKSHGVKMVWNQDGVAYPAWAGHQWRFINKKMRKLYELADHIIYQSDFCRKSANTFLKKTKAPWDIIPNCVDLEKFFPSTVVPTFSPLVLLAAGTHQQPERVMVTLDCLKVLKNRGQNVTLILAGKLDWKEGETKIRDYARALNVEDRIVRIPFFSQTDAPKIYRQAHICIHTKYKDPCPTIVIEAMACGLPIIASKSGGLPELVGEEGGILLDVPDSWDNMYYPDHYEMADAVERVRAELPWWRKRARERAESYFALVSWLERHKNIFNKVLSGDS